MAKDLFCVELRYKFDIEVKEKEADWLNEFYRLFQIKKRV